MLTFLCDALGDLSLLTQRRFLRMPVALAVGASCACGCGLLSFFLKRQVEVSVTEQYKTKLRFECHEMQQRQQAKVAQAS